GRRPLGNRSAPTCREVWRHRARGGDRPRPRGDPMTPRSPWWFPALAGAALLWVPAFAERTTPTRQLPPDSHGIFVESAAETGLNFTHITGATGKYYVAEEMGAGVALLDYDNDGDLDVFLVQGGPLNDQSPSQTPGYPTSRLFRNDLTRGPDGKPRLHFTD